MFVSAGCPSDDRSGRLAFQMQTDPPVLRTAAVVEDQRGLVIVRDDEVRVSVVVEIADRQTASRIALLERCAGARSEINEFTGRGLLEQQNRFLVLQGTGEFLDQIIGIAVTDNEVLVPVVVEIEEL